MLIDANLSLVLQSSVLSRCLHGMRRNLVPGLVLQFVAMTLAALYGTSAIVRTLLDAVGDTKRQLGFAFSAASTALFGGLVPYLVVLASGRVERGVRLRVLLFYVGFWMWKGVEVDAFYRLQAFLLGDAATCGVIAKKAIVDQFGYNPLWAAPTQVWFFLWKDSGFSLAKMRKHLADEPFARRVIIVLVSTWVVWIPTVAIVYSLPSALQIPLFNLVVCFWSLLLTSLSRHER